MEEPNCAFCARAIVIQVCDTRRSIFRAALFTRVLSSHRECNTTTTSDKFKVSCSVVEERRATAATLRATAKRIALDDRKVADGY